MQLEPRRVLHCLSCSETAYHLYRHWLQATFTHTSISDCENDWYICLVLSCSRHQVENCSLSRLEFWDLVLPESSLLGLPKPCHCELHYCSLAGELHVRKNQCDNTIIVIARSRTKLLRKTIYTLSLALTAYMARLLNY